MPINIGEPFEEEQREDVGLEVGSVDNTAQYVGRLTEMSGKDSDIQVDWIFFRSLGSFRFYPTPQYPPHHQP